MTAEILCIGTELLLAWPFTHGVDLDTGGLCGYEALVRWEHDDGTIGAPDTFIPTAERTNLIVDLDRVVLRDALDLLARRDQRERTCRRHTERVHRLAAQILAQRRAEHGAPVGAS